nr:MAG TPA: hypothetical protein [Caudoviricetes sp.]
MRWFIENARQGICVNDIQFLDWHENVQMYFELQIRCRERLSCASAGSPC